MEIKLKGLEDFDGLSTEKMSAEKSCFWSLCAQWAAVARDIPPLLNNLWPAFRMRALGSMVIFLFYFGSKDLGYAQIIPAGAPIFEEALRRKQLLGELDSSISFTHRPLQLRFADVAHAFEDWRIFEPGDTLEVIRPDIKEEMLVYLPVRNTFSLNTGRPYGYGNGLMIPNVGFQLYLTGGVYGKYKYLEYQFMPELVVAQNRPYQGYGGHSHSVNSSRYYFWNTGDFPERFGDNMYAKLWLGNSKVSLNGGSVELALSTQQLWWGPGQFNGLIFSNNAPGFPHLSFNSKRALNTFMGAFEWQIVMGRLAGSGIPSAQSQTLNDRYFREFRDSWRYVNGINFTYQPKWIPGVTVGFTRTHQQYFDMMDAGRLRAWFPIFEGFQKERFAIDMGNNEYSNVEGDQQATVYMRYLLPKAKAELYFEYGRRDHAMNWREFLVNPEHARAYLLGFNKLFTLPSSNHLIQVRGEMTQQLESANRFVRYGPGGGISWHHHTRVRGFTNYGQALGVGIGDAGSNIQTFEISLIDRMNKYGILLERLENHQNFYYQAYGQQDEVQPWVDLSLGFLMDHQIDRLLISSKLQLINGLNYQWQLHPNSTPDFPLGWDFFSVLVQANFVYRLGI